jgi:hypothetical protein
MDQSRYCVLTLLVLAASPLFCQPAPQRSDELCLTLQQTAVEQKRKFTVTRPGACSLNLDAGYDFFVGYDERALYLYLKIDARLLNGDASALWLRMSAFDNLAHTALWTRPQAVFDALNKSIKTLAKDMLEQGKVDATIQNKMDGVYIMAKGDQAAQVIILSAAASVKDIDRMKKRRASEASGEVSTWRRILGASLAAFGEGAQGYANAYRGPSTPQWQSQPMYHAPKTCYTNFIGGTAFTNCY